VAPEAPTSAGASSNGAATSGPASQHAEHVVYIDWLKFLVVYGIVVYHACMPFVYGGGWLIGSRDKSLGLTAFAGFTFPWGIPLLFLLSGAGAYFGLRSKTASAFLRKRIVRLGLPLIAGIALISPMQAYLTSGIVPKNLGGMLDYYPQFLGSLRLEWTLQWLGRYGYHLWFLGYLLVITAVTLPLLEWIRGRNGLIWVARLAILSRHRGGIMLFALPLALSQLLLRPRFPEYQDWADVATYTLAFLAGYVLAADRTFAIAIRRNARISVAIGIASSIAVAAMLVISSGHPTLDFSAQVPYYATFSLFWSLNIWSWCMAVMAMGIIWMEKSNAIVRYGAESALPIYIIHHPVIVVLASFIVAWNLPLWPRFLLLLVSGMAMTVAIYEFGIRRHRITRYIFGMSPAKPASSGRFGTVAPATGMAPARAERPPTRRGTR
jgi:glucan biosynthesis protein C